MTSETVADEVLKSLERGRHDIDLTFQGRLLVFVSRFFPRLADRIARRKVREIFREEIAARKTSTDQNPVSRDAQRNAGETRSAARRD